MTSTTMTTTGQYVGAAEFLSLTYTLIIIDFKEDATAVKFRKITHIYINSMNVTSCSCIYCTNLMCLQNGTVRVRWYSSPECPLFACCLRIGGEVVFQVCRDIFVEDTSSLETNFKQMNQ